MKPFNTTKYPKERKASHKYNKIYFITNNLAKDKKQLNSLFMDNVEYSYVKKINNFKYDNIVNDIETTTMYINIFIDKEETEEELKEFATIINGFLNTNYKLFYKNYEKTIRFSTASKVVKVEKMIENFISDDDVD